MRSNNNNKLKAFVRFDGSGRVVSSSLIVQAFKPKVGNWKEIDAKECCNYTSTTTSTTTIQSTNWTFVPDQQLVWPIDQNGYTLYEGAWTAFDDGQTVDSFPFVDDFYATGVASTTFIINTNGRAVVNVSNFDLFGNGGDLYIEPGTALNDGDTQNFWYLSSGPSTKWKNSILVYCGHCCGIGFAEKPYSYIINVYRDDTYQYLETRIKTDSSISGVSNGVVGITGATGVATVQSQVWRSGLLGLDWALLGNGIII
jgi:hypothetical protein